MKERKTLLKDGDAASGDSEQTRHDENKQTSIYIGKAQSQAGSFDTKRQGQISQKIIRTNNQQQKQKKADENSRKERKAKTHAVSGTVATISAVYKARND
jgi:hypothetical protein